jgi:hypothetical protein
VDIKNKDPAEDLEIQGSDTSAQRNEITEADLREALKKEYYKGQWKDSPKSKPQGKEKPKNLASQELDDLVGVKRTDQSYADQVRDKYQKKRDKSNQKIQEKFARDDDYTRNPYPQSRKNGILCNSQRPTQIIAERVEAQQTITMMIHMTIELLMNPM